MSAATDPTSSVDTGGREPDNPSTGGDIRDPQTRRPFQISPTLANFIAGTVGGVAGVVTGHPFDTIKVRLQSQSASNPIYKSTGHCARSIVRNEGFKGLFKGMSSPIVGVAAVNALLFGVYGALLDWQMSPSSTVGAQQQQPTLWQIFLAGSGSGVINAFISSPIELIKIRMQNQGVGELLHPTAASSVTKSITNPIPNHQIHSKPTMGPLECARSVWQTGGVRGIYRGLGVTLVRETPSYGAYFLSYELLCRKLAPDGTDPKELSGVRLMLAGGLGGIVGWASTYPVDVVKTMVQDDAGGKRMPLLTTLRDLYRQQGIGSWFRGFAATVLRAFPTNVAILSTWHLSMMYFRRSGLLNGTTTATNTTSSNT